MCFAQLDTKTFKNVYLELLGDGHYEISNGRQVIPRPIGLQRATVVVSLDSLR